MWQNVSRVMLLPGPVCVIGALQPVFNSGVIDSVQRVAHLPEVCCAVVTLSSCEVVDEGVGQRDAERLAGLELKHKVISVRPLVGTLGARSRSDSSAASRSTALYLQVTTLCFRCMQIGTKYYLLFKSYNVIFII